jgi:ribosome-associated toxin RatA of RatAB toxin-antitoxin module
MATVQESITVDVPVRQAYNQWTQFEDFPNFMSGVDAVRQLDDTTVHFETSIAGVKREYDAQITVQEPDQRVTWESLNEPRNSGTVWFEALGADETKVNVELTWEPESAVEKLGAATGLDSRQVASDLRKFKKFIEERDTETGAWRESVSGGEVEGDAGSTAAGTGVGTGTGVGAGTPGAGTGAGLGAAGQQVQQVQQVQQEPVMEPEPKRKQASEPEPWNREKQEGKQVQRGPVMEQEPQQEATATRARAPATPRGPAWTPCPAAATNPKTPTTLPQPSGP